jgi:hypothetical protein
MPNGMLQRYKRRYFANPNVLTGKMRKYGSKNMERSG